MAAHKTSIMLASSAGDKEIAMRKLFFAVSAVALAAAAGAACAQAPAGPRQGPGGILFQSDTNRDGTLTRAEFNAGRTAEFARLDANHDGSVTREERRAGHMDRGGRRGGGHRGMERADANSDGNISREEFLAGPTRHFERVDANHDGVITAAERPQRREHAEGARRERPADPDTNNDGSLSQAEFNAAGVTLFDRLDANHDGSVTRAEADAARPHRGGPPAPG
jgi:EF hand